MNERGFASNLCLESKDVYGFMIGLGKAASTLYQVWQLEEKLESLPIFLDFFTS